MNPKTKLFTVLSLLVLATLVFVPAALAFDGRSADRVVIESGEVINEDLYITAREVIVDGTINGDLLAAGESVVINGKVTGDLWAAGRTVTLNGEVGDDVFAAAAVVTLGSEARVVDDAFTAAASVESAAGSQVGGTLFIGAFQGLVSGQVAEDLFSGSSRLRIEGTIQGDAKIAINNTDDSYTPGPWMFGPDTPSMPSVPSGLTFGKDAEIAGLLEYTSPLAISIPSGIAAAVQHQLPPVDAQVSKEISSNDGPDSFVLDTLRRLVALLLVGLLLARLVPAWIMNPAARLQARPWPSLGMGMLSLIIAPFALLAGLALVILVAVLVGALTLGELVGAVLGVGLPALALLTAAFFLMLGYLPQAIIAFLGGRWILQRTRPASADNIYWALLVGLVVLGILMSVPVLGGLLSFLVILAGLGALVLLFLDRRAQPAIVQA